MTRWYYSLYIIGVPEGQGRRATAWRILLNYLPESQQSWPDYLNKQRKLYNQFLGKYNFESFTIPLRDFFCIVITKILWLPTLICFAEEIIIQPLEKAAEEDHPLNPNPNSQWQSFFKDNEVLLQVCTWHGLVPIRPISLEIGTASHEDIDIFNRLIKMSVDYIQKYHSSRSQLNIRMSV